MLQSRLACGVGFLIECFSFRIVYEDVDGIFSGFVNVIRKSNIVQTVSSFCLGKAEPITTCSIIVDYAV
jgi:hypothetical protein